MDAHQFTRFCEDVLEHPAGEDMGRPLRLEDWQVDLFAEALELDAAGRPRWQTVATCIPRGNGKTTMLAAYALYRLLADADNPKILMCAASDRQANRLFEAARGMVERSPFLLDRLAIQDYRGRLYRKDGQGEILRLSSKPETALGFRPSLVICDELAQWVQPQLRRTWAAHTTGGVGRQHAQVFAISTAGRAHEREEGILGRMLDANEAAGRVTRPHAGLTVARNDDASVLTFNYAAPTSSVEDVDAVKLANPRRGVTREWLARQLASPETTTAEKLQLHAGVWSALDETWVALEAWGAAANPAREVRVRAKVVLGLDGSRGGAYGHDATALIGATIEERPHLFLLGVWERPAHLQRGEEWDVPAGEVDQAVSEAFERLRVERFYCDAHLWQTEVDQWQGRWSRCAVRRFPVNRPARMGEALERFTTDLHGGRFTHDAHPVLTRHVLTARRHETRGTINALLVPPGGAERLHIDAAIAAVLAYTAAREAQAAGEGASDFAFL